MGPSVWAPQAGQPVSCLGRPTNTSTASSCDAIRYTVHDGGPDSAAIPRCTGGGEPPFRGVASRPSLSEGPREVWKLERRCTLLVRPNRSTTSAPQHRARRQSPVEETLHVWLRGQVQGLIQRVLEEVREFLGRQRHQRRAEVSGVQGYRNGVEQAPEANQGGGAVARGCTCTGSPRKTLR